MTHKILGLDSAVKEASSGSPHTNMYLSKALVLEMAGRIEELEQKLKQVVLADQKADFRFGLSETLCNSKIKRFDLCQTK